MQTKEVMRGLIFGKLILVIAAFALYQGWIQIGDLPSMAADGDKVASDNSEKKDAEKESDKDAKDAKAGDAKREVAEEDPATKSRKSFLSDLFELPKLDPKSARKEEIGKYLDMADRKDRQIKERETMLTRREEQLKNMEKSIDEKLAKMDEERKFIAKTLQQEKDLKGERLEKLITLYDKMEPKKAAPQIEKLDKDLVVALFKGLKQKQVTTILEFMSPDKSVELTEYFGRVKSGREYDLLKELNSSLKKEFAECKGMPESEPTASTKTASKADAKADSKADAKTSADPKAAAKPDSKEAH